MTTTYVTYDTIVSLDDIGWGGQLGAFTHVVGHSALGVFFLYEPSTSEHGFLYPERGGYKSYGPKSPQEFREQILDDAYVQQVIFLSDKVEQLQQRLGPLARQEVYIATPYEVMGGSGDISTYEKGDALVYASIVAQMVHGFGG